MTHEPSNSPCAFCPYRLDVPSGVWDESEYEKLPPYDGPTQEQPTRVFNCHLYNHGSDQARLCSGWAGCHDMNHSMALRISLAGKSITPETYEATLDYVSPVPLFKSGEEAAEHGMREINSPAPEARKAILRIARVRSDLEGI